MALPERVRVKLVSDEAGYISSARVMQREYPMHELLEALVSVTGKNLDRLRQILRAGSVVVDKYRHRWAPFEAQAADLEPLLARFPDPQPDRPFVPDRCVHATIRAGVETIELPREQAAQRRFLKKQTFWDLLMEVAAAGGPRYQTYSYRDRADVYAFEPTREQEQRLREAAALLRLERVEERIRLLPLEKITLLVNR